MDPTWDHGEPYGLEVICLRSLLVRSNVIVARSKRCSLVVTLGDGIRRNETVPSTLPVDLYHIIDCQVIPSVGTHARASKDLTDRPLRHSVDTCSMAVHAIQARKLKMCASLRAVFHSICSWQAF